MVGYSETPFITKMGIKQGMRGIFVHAPKEVRLLFEHAPLSIVKGLFGDLDYIHIFAKDEESLNSAFLRVKKFLKPDGILWASWPKSGQLGTNLNENKVRDIGLAAGLVDIKVAAINDTRVLHIELKT